MDLAQELLINVQCSSVLTSFAKETRALKMRSTVASYWKLTTSNWEDHWSWSSDNYMRSCWRTQWYSMVVQHLKQTGKAKKLDKWMAHEFTKKKKKESFVLKCHLLLFSATTTNHFLIKLWCAIKSVFLYDNQEWPAHCLDQETPKHCQSQTCTKKKGHRSLLGGLLLEWSITAFWISVKPLHLGSTLKNWWDALKTAIPAAGIGQQKVPNSSAWQHPTAHCTSNTPEVWQIGLKVLPHSSYSADLLPTN